MPKDQSKSKSPKDFQWLKNYPVDVDWNEELDEKSMVQIFDEAVAKYGDRTCINFLDKKYTFKEVGELVDHMAKGFQDQGVKKDSKVGLCLPNTPFYMISYFGALKAGGTVVNFNPLYAEKELAHQIDDSHTEIMVTMDLEQIYPNIELMLRKTKSLEKVVVCNLADALPPIKGMLFNAVDSVSSLMGKPKTISVPSDAEHIKFTDMLKNDGNPTPVTIDPKNDVAVLQYTGGTTGVPKGAMLTHKNLASNIQQVDKWFTTAQEDGEKVLAVLPFFHVFAMTVEMNLSLQMGAELIMIPKPELEGILKVIDKEKPTIFAGVPTLYKGINDFMGMDKPQKPKLTAGVKAWKEYRAANKIYKKAQKIDLSSLQTCMAGGAPLPKDVQETFEKISGCKLFEGYGLSESSPVVTANPLNGKNKVGSIGIPVPKTELKLTDLDFPDKEVGINVKGEICLRGPQIMKGYYNNEEATKNTIDPDGFLRTGDVGIMDEDGYVTIVDRIKDMIIASGFNVYPRKVEDAILEHPDVDECIVAGVPDEKRGETVKAWIVMKPGKKDLSFEELKEFLQDKLTGYERPKQLDFRTELPKTMIGKPSRKDLVEEEKAKAEAKQANKPKGPKGPGM